MKVLRRRLIQAGIFDPRAVGYFFVARTALAVGLAVAVFFLLPMIVTLSGSMFWLLGRSSAASSAMSLRACISTGASPRAATSIAPAFRISWTCWWSAPIPA